MQQSVMRGMGFSSSYPVLVRNCRDINIVARIARGGAIRGPESGVRG